MGDFLQREQAHMEVLGDVGANFGETPQEANNGDDDLLGEGAQEFADAYPSVESQNQNEVGIENMRQVYKVGIELTYDNIASRPWRDHHRLRLSFPSYWIPEHRTRR